MAKRSEKCLEEPGECEIDWLTDSDRKVLDYFDNVHSFSGMWRNKRSRFWIWFWTIVQVGWMTVYFYSIPFLVERLDLFAHLIHHSVLGLDDLMYVDLLSKKKEYVKSVAEGVTKTYSYDSQMVKNYHKKLMSARLKRQDLLVAKFMTTTSVSLFIHLEVFFILEATLLKNYETMYPIHLPFDIHHPATYICIVLMQKLTIFVTVLMVRGICCLMYSAYCHLNLEFDVLIYAVTHINDLVAEKMLKANCKMNSEDKEKFAKFYYYYCYHFAKHHVFIRKYFYNVKKACEILILSVLFSGLICFACVGITSLSVSLRTKPNIISRCDDNGSVISEDNLGVKLKFVLIMILQTIVIYGMCWTGEDITSKAEELRKELACIPWWLMPKKCHSTILMMLLGCQIPMQLTTPFNQVANREGFKVMTSNSYSCFSLMYQMKFSK